MADLSLLNTSLYVNIYQVAGGLVISAANQKQKYVEQWGYANAAAAAPGCSPYTMGTEAMLPIKRGHSLLFRPQGYTRRTTRSRSTRCSKTPCPPTPSC